MTGAAGITPGTGTPDRVAGRTRRHPGPLHEPPPKKTPQGASPWGVMAVLIGNQHRAHLDLPSLLAPDVGVYWANPNWTVTTARGLAPDRPGDLRPELLIVVGVPARWLAKVGIGATGRQLVVVGVARAAWKRVPTNEILRVIAEQRRLLVEARKARTVRGRADLEDDLRKARKAAIQAAVRGSAPLYVPGGMR